MVGYDDWHNVVGHEVIEFEVHEANGQKDYATSQKGRFETPFVLYCSIVAKYGLENCFIDGPSRFEIELIVNKNEEKG